MPQIASQLRRDLLCRFAARRQFAQPRTAVLEKQVCAANCTSRCLHRGQFWFEGLSGWFGALPYQPESHAQEQKQSHQGAVK